MSVIFESRIRCNRIGEVYIELKDLVDGRVEICDNVDDYALKIEKLGEDYGGHIDEVKWFVDDDVPPAELDKIRLSMSKYQKELNK